MSYSINSVFKDGEASISAFYAYADNNNPASIEAGGSCTLKYFADGIIYKLPADVKVKVTSATKPSGGWTRNTDFTEGTLTITNPTGDVIVTIECAHTASPMEVGPFISPLKTPIDTRIVLTKAQMLTIDETTQPIKYFALCRDDNKIYVYDANNERDQVTGKFRLYAQSYNDLTDKPIIPDAVVANPIEGEASETLTKLQVGSAIYNVPSGGSGITGIMMNESAVTVTEGVANLGTVITSHQDISGKQDVIDTNHKLSADYVSGLATVATSGSYNDLINTPNFAAVATSGDYTDLINTPTIPDVSNFVERSELASVATSGSYTDLQNTPRIIADVKVNGSSVVDTNNIAQVVIPTQTSDLTNNSGFITNTTDSLTNYTKTSDLATVATSGAYNDLTDFPTLATVATSGNYNDLLDKPDPAHNQTIAVDGSPVVTFGADDTVTLTSSGDIAITADNSAKTINLAIGTVYADQIIYTPPEEPEESLQSALYDQQNAINGLDEAIWDDNGGLNSRTTALEATVGDVSGGLVKDVNTLKTVVGGVDSGLVKAVATLSPVTLGPVDSDNYNKFLKIEESEGEGYFTWANVPTPTIHPLYLKNYNDNTKVTYDPTNSNATFKLYSLSIKKNVSDEQPLLTYDPTNSNATFSFSTIINEANGIAGLDSSGKVPITSLHTDPEDHATTNSKVVVYDSEGKIPTDRLHTDVADDNVAVYPIQPGNISSKQAIVGSVFTASGQLLVGDKTNNNNFKTLNLGTNGQLLGINNNGNVAWVDAPQTVTLSSAANSGLTVSDSNGAYTIGIDNNYKLLKITEWNDLTANQITQTNIDSIVAAKGYTKNAGTVTSITLLGNSGLTVTGGTNGTISSSGIFTVAPDSTHKMLLNNEWPPKTVKATKYTSSGVDGEVELSFVYCDSQTTFDNLSPKRTNTIYIIENTGATGMTINAPTILWQQTNNEDDYTGITWGKVLADGSTGTEVDSYTVYAGNTELETIGGTGANTYTSTTNTRIALDTTYTVKCNYTTPSGGVITSVASNPLTLLNSEFTPTNFNTSTATDYTLTWNRVNKDIEGYQIIIGNNTYPVSQPVSENPTWLWDSTTDLSTAKNYQVRTILCSADGLYSGVSSTKSLSLTAPTLTASVAELSWTNIPDGATHIEIYKEGSDSVFATVGRATTSYTITNSPAGTKYRVRAIQKINDTVKFTGAYSDWQALHGLTAPIISFTGENSETQIEWTAVTGATGYIVAVNGDNQEYQTTLTYLTGLSNSGQGQTYKVKAVVKSNDTTITSSGYSNSLTTTPRAITITAPADANVSYRLDSFSGTLIDMPYYVVKGTPSITIYCAIADNTTYSFYTRAEEWNDNITGINANDVNWKRSDEQQV